MDKMKTLALEDLDIEELERRLELALAGPSPLKWGTCPTNCGADCDQVCGALYICDPNLIR
jgi:hypothetical protein